jgi:renin receptor
MNRLIGILALITAASCNQLQILHAPKSVEFKGSSELNGDSLSDVFAAALGYSVKSLNEWDGLYLNDPFKPASGVLAVIVEGDDLDIKSEKSYNLIGETDFDSTLQTTVLEHSHIAYGLDLSDVKDEVISTQYGAIPALHNKNDVHYLKDNKWDKQFLNQLAFINGLIKTLGEEKELPSALIVKTSLKQVKSMDNEGALSEAKKLLEDAIERLNVAVQKIYKGAALFAVVTVDEHHSRTRRDVDPKQANTEDYNLAPIYDPNYPVIFNIILWFSIILIFTLLAIALSIARMEDKDSIIYRMTSTRMKKDN